MKQPLKIALLSGGLEFGGSTTFLVNLISGFKSVGVSCAIFNLSKANPFEKDFAALDTPVHLCDERRTIFEDRLMATYHEIAKFNPNVAIANMGADSYEVLRYMPAGVTRIGMIHDMEMAPGRLVPRYCETLDGIATVNRHLAREVEAAAPGLPCRYLAHGIPLREDSFVRDPNPAGPLKIIYFGRLVEPKGTKLFPKIIDELHQRRIPFEWTMHGHGADRDYLRTRLGREIASGEVVLSQEIARDEVPPLVRRHDIFIMASEVEGGPLTLLEAMSLGLVPICNDIPCLVQEVVNSGNGFCIPREPVRYAESIAILDRDRPLMERMSISARSIIGASYSNKAMAERYVAFIESIASVIAPVVWQRKINPMPILGSDQLLRLAQSHSIARQARRLMKRIRS